MKILKKVMLVNWYNFKHEVFEFDDKINVITGANGVGKSTVIDALQFLLMPSAGSSYIFNKSGNTSGKRKLISYLRGDMIENERGIISSIRESFPFTSYICAEWVDNTGKECKSFVAGCAFECNNRDTILRTFFIYDKKLDIDDYSFIAENGKKRFYDYSDFKKNIKKQQGFSSFDSGNMFGKEICSKLGGMDYDKFERLMKKTVAFVPFDSGGGNSISQFISEFIGDDADTEPRKKEREVLENMRSEFRYYNELREIISTNEKKIEKLEEIIKTDHKCKQIQDKIKQKKYLFLKAGLDKNSKQLKERKENIVCLNEEIKKINMVNEELKEVKEIKNAEYRTQRMAFENNEVQRGIDSIKINIKNNEAKIKEIEESFLAKNNLARNILLHWRNKISKKIHIPIWINQEADKEMMALNKCLIEYEHDVLEFKEKLEAIKDFCNIMSNNDDEARKILFFDVNTIDSVMQIINKLFDNVKVIANRIQSIYEDISKKCQSLKTRKLELENGITHFPKEIVKFELLLKSELKNKYGEDTASVLANIIEVKDDKWSRAIESYLKKQKFNIIVSPDFFDFATNVYVEKCFDYKSGGIVNVKKIIEQNPQPLQNSLAEEIESENFYAKVYVNYLLGKVIKCEHYIDLEKYRIAITPDCILYSNFAVQKMDPNASRYIGKKGAKHQLSDVIVNIEVLEKEKTEIEELLCAFQNIYLTKDNLNKTISKEDVESLFNSASEVSTIENIYLEIKELNERINKIDVSGIEAIGNRVKQLEVEIKNIENEIEKNKENIREKKSLLENFEKFIIFANEETHRLSEKISNEFDTEWVVAVGNIEYEKEVKRGNPFEVIERKNEKEDKMMSILTDEKAKLYGLKTEYNTIYKSGFDIGENNSEFQTQFEILSSDELPKYKEDFEKNKEQIFKTYQTYFLGTLNNNIENIKNKINNVNKALSNEECVFGGDRFHVIVEDNKGNEHYLNMFKDSVTLMGGGNLFTKDFEEKHKDAIEELFGKMFAEDEWEKKMMYYMDYKTYLSFDLQVTNNQGKQRLSKNIKSKSGGETQTPFYIVILASFVNLYRIHKGELPAPQQRPRLIIFDEAFSKMDEERIASSIKLFKDFGFQLIISIPENRLQDIRPIANCTIALRENKSGKKFQPEVVTWTV